MITTIILLIVIALACIGVFLLRYKKRYDIRKTGRAVTAKVTEVRCWQDAATRGNMVQLMRVPVFAGGWQYEVTAEWTDPHSEQTYLFSSGRKKGLPSAKRGDYLNAYMSPSGNYLELP